MLNKWEGIGRLTKDPELRYTNGGIAVCNFSVACRNGYGNEKSTQYIKCAAWKKTAENISRYLCKGRLVHIEGILIIKKNNKNGRTYTNPYISVRQILFLGGEPKDKRDNNEEDDNKAPESMTKNRVVSSEDDDIDVPF